MTRGSVESRAGLLLTELSQQLVVRRGGRRLSLDSAVGSGGRSIEASRFPNPLRKGLGGLGRGELLDVLEASRSACLPLLQPLARNLTAKSRATRTKDQLWA